MADTCANCGGPLVVLDAVNSDGRFVHVAYPECLKALRLAIHRLELSRQHEDAWRQPEEDHHTRCCQAIGDLVGELFPTASLDERTTFAEGPRTLATAIIERVRKAEGDRGILELAAINLKAAIVESNQAPASDPEQFDPIATATVIVRDYHRYACRLAELCRKYFGNEHYRREMIGFLEEKLAERSNARADRMDESLCHAREAIRLAGYGVRDESDVAWLGNFITLESRARKHASEAAEMHRTAELRLEKQLERLVEGLRSRGLVAGTNDPATAALMAIDTLRKLERDVEHLAERINGGPNRVVAPLASIAAHIDVLAEGREELHRLRRYRSAMDMQARTLDAVAGSMRRDR